MRRDGSVTLDIEAVEIQMSNDTGLAGFRPGHWHRGVKLISSMMFFQANLTQR